MTTVITRLYKSKKAATTVMKALQDAGFPDATLDIIEAGTEDAEGVMIAARVPKDSAAIYSTELAEGTALLIARAPFTPFGAAREAMRIVDAQDSLPSAVANDNAFVKDEPKTELYLSVLTNHPLFMTDRKEMSRNDGRISTGFGWKLLSRDKPRRSAISGGRFMSRAFWPMPLLSEHKDRRSAIPGGKKFLTG